MIAALLSLFFVIQPAPAAGPVVLNADSTADEVLLALQERGRDLKTLTAKVSLADADPATGQRSIRAGEFWLDTAADETRLRVRFETRQDGNRLRTDPVDYLLRGDTLIERQEREKREVRRKVLKPGEKINLLKLGEGPFPIPLGQDREQVLKEFEAERVNSRASDPPNTLRLKLTPRPNVRFARQFSSMTIIVGTEDHLPHTMILDKGDAGIVQTVDLKDIQINTGADAARFELPRINAAEWNIIEETMRD